MFSSPYSYGASRDLAATVGATSRMKQIGAGVADIPRTARSAIEPDILLLSQRRIADLAAYCLGYEFEDVLTAVTSAERIDVVDFPALEFSRRVYKVARLASGSSGFARMIAPSPRGRVVLERDFDLFFPVFAHTHELYSLAAIPNWRERCRIAACFITEVWSDRLPEYLLELLSRFDHVFIGTSHPVKDVARLTGRPCTHLPLGVDVLRFAPSPDQRRPIEVCNIGRRSPVTHRALLDDAERRQSFYYYDTVAASGSDKKDRTFHVDNPQEHRRKLATLLKHSRWFIANRAYVDRPEFTAGRDEVSARFYEGAAAGAVMIGEAPRTEEFARQFDWPDALIHMPFDSPDIGGILADLNGQPGRLQAISGANVRQAAQRHDWLHRILAVFDTLGLPPTAKMRARAQSLDAIASRAH